MTVLTYVKRIKMKAWQIILNIVRKYGQLQFKLTKVQTDIYFSRICEVEYLIPKFANFKVSTRHENKKFKMKRYIA